MAPATSVCRPVRVGPPRPHMNNCKQGGCLKEGPKVCPTCVDWTPSQGSKYYRCARYEATRATCDKPPSVCETCPYYEPREETDEPGRPNLSGRDWKDPATKRDYMRDYMRRRRAEEDDEFFTD